MRYARMGVGVGAHSTTIRCFDRLRALVGFVARRLCPRGLRSSCTSSLRLPARRSTTDLILKRMLILTALMATLAVSRPAAQKADSGDGMPEDELVFMDVPTVVTASRREQPVTESPAAVFVVTAEDIKRSGATTIPDALRLVPGVDVVSISGGNQSVSVRGFFTEPFSTKLLVMVDGRSVYWDVYGTVLWNMIPVSLEEIDRIEVIVSPASSLYGSNAYSGVINIITKSPGDIEGLSVRLAIGEYRTLLGTGVFGFYGKSLSFRGAFEIEQGDEVGAGREPATDLRRGNATVEYRFSDATSVSVSGGRVAVEEGTFFADELVGSVDLSGNADYLQIDADIGSFSLRTFGKREDIDAGFNSLGITIPWFTWLADIELLHTLELGRISTLVTGANYRYNNVRSNAWIPEDHAHHLFALFADGELRIGSKLRLNLGIRYDWHPLTLSKLSPRGAISYMFSDDHTVRLTAGMAYRNPTFVESYLDLYIPSESNPVGVPLSAKVEGSADLAPEDIVSVELSHRGAWTESIISDVNAFYRRYRHLYRLVENAYMTDSDTGFVRAFADNWDAFGVGGEAQLRYEPFDWLHVFANYSLVYIGSTTSERGAALDTVTLIRSSPHHQANIGVELNIVGFALSAYAQYRGARQWMVYETSSDIDGELPAALIVNCRAAYAFKNAEVSMSAFDLFDKQLYEYPASGSDGYEGSYPLQQKVTAQLRCTF